MGFTTKIIKLNKRYPFTISRGTRSYSHNIFLFLEDQSHVGIGECDPGNFDAQTHSKILENFLSSHDFCRSSIYELWQHAHEQGLPKPTQAALDIALWDLLAKKAGLPCFQLFGLHQKLPPTSITLGITPLEHISSRVLELLGHKRFRALKIKLGSPEGINYDKEAFLNIKQAALSFGVSLRIDANGGWSLADAQIMCHWLAQHGVEYIEQPLSPELDDALPELFKTRPLPLFLDESIQLSNDIVRLKNYCDGVNIKLMKCGGITEALRMVSVAKAHNLKTMIGCMSESSISISAAASIGSLFDYIDLDSAFNLNPDPAQGITLINGSLVPGNDPGHGARLC